MFRPLLLLVALSGAIASHFRFGTMSWKRIGTTNEVEFSISLSWRASAFRGPICSGSLKYGDGNNVNSVCITSTAASSVDDWVLGDAKFKHTYAAPNNRGSPWVVTFAGCCRIGGLKILANSNHDIMAGVDLDLASESPIMQQLPVLTMFTGDTPTFTVAIADAFGRQPTVTLLNSGTPVTLKDNVATVDVSTKNKGWWPVGLRADFRGGFIPVDFIIIIKDPVKLCTGTGADCSSCSSDQDCLQGSCLANKNPVVTVDADLCFSPGKETEFKIEATDANACQRLYIQSGGLPSGASITSEDSSMSPVSRTVKFTPPDNHNQIVCFSAYDALGGSSPSSCALLKIGAQGAEPSISSFSPSKVTKSGGATIEIVGSDMGSNAGGQCTIGGEVVRAQFVSDTKVVCDVPALAAGLYDVEYNALPCGPKKKASTQIELTETPSVSSLSPVTSKAANGFTSLDIDLTISGSSYTTAAGVNTNPKCRVGSTSYDAVIVNTNQMTCTVTVTSAGTFSLSTSNDGVSFSNSRAFLVYELPGLTSFEDKTNEAPSTGGLIVANGDTITDGTYCRLDDYYYRPQVVVSDKKIKCLAPALGATGGPNNIADDKSTTLKFYLCGEWKDDSSCSSSLDVTYYRNVPQSKTISVAEGDGCTGVVDVTAGNLDPMFRALKCKFDGSSTSYTVTGSRLGDIVQCPVPIDIDVDNYKVELTNDGKYFSADGPAFKVAIAVPQLNGWRTGRSINNVGPKEIRLNVKGVAAGAEATVVIGGTDADGEESAMSFTETAKVTDGYVEMTIPAVDIPVGLFSNLYLPVVVTVQGKSSCDKLDLNIYAQCRVDSQCPEEGVCDQLTGRCLPSPCGHMCEKCEPTIITSGINYQDIDYCGKCNKDTGKCDCIDGWGDPACTSPVCKKVATGETGGKMCPGSVTYDDCADDPSKSGRQVCQKGCDIMARTGQDIAFGTEYCPAEKATCNTAFFKYCECDQGWTGYECNIEEIEAPPPTPYVQPKCTKENPFVCGSPFTTTCNPDLKCATRCDAFTPCNSDSTCTEITEESVSYCKCNAGKIGLECEMAAGAGGTTGGGTLNFGDKNGGASQAGPRLLACSGLVALLFAFI